MVTGMRSSSHLDSPGHSLTDALMAADPLAPDAEATGIRAARPRGSRRSSS